MLWPFLSAEIDDAPLSLSERLMLSLQAESSSASAPFVWDGVRCTWALTGAPELPWGQAQSPSSLSSKWH